MNTNTSAKGESASNSSPSNTHASAFEKLTPRGFQMGSRTGGKRSSTIFLQVVLVILSLFALALLLWEPHLEGRNANASVFEIYFKDPFLAYAYLGSVPFFIAFYQGFKLLGYIGRNEVFSQKAVKALRTVKYCAIILVAFVLGAEAYIFTVIRGKDDSAGGVAVGIFIIFGSVVIGTAAAVFESILQNAVEIKSENDLTV